MQLFFQNIINGASETVTSLNTIAPFKSGPPLMEYEDQDMLCEL